MPRKRQPTFMVLMWLLTFVVMIYKCLRMGYTANPSSFRLSDFSANDNLIRADNIAPTMQLDWVDTGKVHGMRRLQLLPVSCHQGLNDPGCINGMLSYKARMQNHDAVFYARLKHAKGLSENFTQQAIDKLNHGFISGLMLYQNSQPFDDAIRLAILDYEYKARIYVLARVAKLTGIGNSIDFSATTVARILADKRFWEKHRKVQTVLQFHRFDGKTNTKHHMHVRVDSDLPEIAIQNSNPMEKWMIDAQARQIDAFLAQANPKSWIIDSYNGRYIKRVGKNTLNTYKNSGMWSCIEVRGYTNGVNTDGLPAKIADYVAMKNDEMLRKFRELYPSRRKKKRRRYGLQ